MPLFGHTETGIALDVWEHVDIASYLSWASRIPGSDKWAVEQLPDGTVSGAKSDGHGGWINPGTPEPMPADPQPLPLTRTDFLALLANNGGDLSEALKNWPLG